MNTFLQRCMLPRLAINSRFHNAWRTPYSTDVQKSIDEMVKKSKVVVFMKGVPEAPRCGFSNAVVQILRMHDVPYDSHDVLKDESIRNGIKEYTSWPTIPQVFINGEFVGGCDILLKLHQSGELVEQLEKVNIKSALKDKKEDSPPT
ncbi:glutaredoxin-related protein 5, mitochondrial-like [Diaphorina citri]|uniref:Glutaredoxin-related protein 5, mitochondrial n=1 Tax=Diaphorina citri TaxID=121845 RepID=A0A1S3DJU5_DIACI|nr:glutaredoxin-related protein 5, mitochondrial-like [Diaphorina citri]